MEGRFGHLARQQRNTIIGWLVDVAGQALFPHFCLKCSEEGGLLCSKCSEDKDTRPTGVFWCPACGIESVYGKPCLDCAENTEFTSAISMVTYGQKLPQKLLQVWKYQGVSEAGDILNGMFQDFIGQHKEMVGELFQDRVVVPVPLHPFRLAERGFNQAEVIAKVLSEAAGLKVRTDILKRSWQRKKQATIDDPVKRLANAANSVVVRSGVSMPDKIVLVDDVMTTGATLSLCARKLKEVGCKDVSAVTLLRG